MTRSTRPGPDGNRDLGQEHHHRPSLDIGRHDLRHRGWRGRSGERGVHAGPHHAEGRRPRDRRQPGPVSHDQRQRPLRLGPKTTITIGEQKPATIIELLDGTLHVKAGKRHDGDTLSIETQYLVATVKGTEFMVAVADEGAAVSVTEGVVSVRSTRTNEAFDVFPGQTALVSLVHGSLPTIVATACGRRTARAPGRGVGDNRQQQPSPAIARWPVRIRAATAEDSGAGKTDRR